MKIFSIIEPTSRELIELASRKHGIDHEAVFPHGHPQEDYLLVSDKYPIFVVADGVTLIQHIFEKGSYPNPSPAGDVSRIFCEALMRAAEERYESFVESDLSEIFKIGNEAVRRYNETHGRTKETTDYWDNDLYAATAAFAVLKGNTLYWGSICDSYVSHFRDGQPLFKSPDCDIPGIEAPKYTGDPNDRKARAMYVWRVRRNGVDEEGKPVGYGVVTGERAAERYLNAGALEVVPGDLVAIYTDGFEEYMGLPETLGVLAQGLEGREGEVRAFTSAKSKQDPDKFGHERSLVVVLV